ncbi:membrane-associated protein, putative [Bodo saltans]|uniref:cholesterol 7-desaturase n=1 Tax=Bodo saltans TaxID=75058 RepID=A0A0S4JAF8_BODSA|nr:membrane-associated protein, putative [Bodo saltans]|eukprot:CUG87202.1 membrane-associated protein, putative [Bodo saltans]
MILGDYNGLSIALLVFFVLYLIYTRCLFPRFNKPPGTFKGNFDHKHPDFIQRRLRKFPPPYPNGWYKLCDVTDLAHGNIVSVTCLGLDLVVFRGKNTQHEGAIGVLDAFCPHLGAHLGQGGTVDKGCIKCPFHGWRMNTDGKCESIPYLEPGCPVPQAAGTKVYTHCVYNGMVFLWFHAEGEDPTFELMKVPITSSWVRHGTACTTYDMHIVDMAENSADYFHFNYLHGPVEVPLLKSLIHMTYNTKVFFPDDEAKRHTIYFENYATTIVLKFLTVPYIQKTRVTFDGPGVVHFDIQTPLGHMWLIKTNLPRRPFDLYSEDAWFAEPRTPRWLVRLVTTIAKGALEQDREVWQNRLFTGKPFLVKGDGPFPQYRKWFDQFYSENSVKVAQERTALTW